MSLRAQGEHTGKIRDAATEISRMQAPKFPMLIRLDLNPSSRKPLLNDITRCARSFAFSDVEFGSWGGSS